MSLTGALNNAAGGLAANARSAGLVSSNIANALTEGYGRRELTLSSDPVSTHGGVRMDAVIRHMDPGLLSDRRNGDARLAADTVRSQHAAGMEQLVGAALDAESLPAMLDAFEASLISAAADPSSPARLSGVGQAAKGLVTKINSISAGIQETRREAEAAIAVNVDRLNEGLARIADLNVRISRLVNLGRDTSALQDQRQVQIDKVAEIVPVRVIDRGRDTVALIANGGAVLLDGKPPVLEFTRANEIAPHMTIDAGLLSGLTLNGRQVRTGSDGPLAGGALAAQFDVRDVETVALQSRIDGIALELAHRFGPGGPDASLAVGDPGVFTDMGLAAVPADLNGLADRLRLNAALDPSAATLWHWRDGIGAVAPGPAGDARLLNGLRDVLTSRVAPTAPGLAPHAQSLSDFAAGLSAQVSDARVDGERDLAFAQGAQLALREKELTQGVDTDAELQRLMQIEQAYAANARVLQVVDDLMTLLLR